MADGMPPAWARSADGCRREMVDTSRSILTSLKTFVVCDSQRQYLGVSASWMNGTM